MRVLCDQLIQLISAAGGGARLSRLYHVTIDIEQYVSSVEAERERETDRGLLLLSK